MLGTERERERRERPSFSARRESVWRNHKAPLAERADVGQCNRGSMPSNRAPSMFGALRIFSLSPSFSLSLPTHAAWLSAAGYYILAPALSPGSLFHIGRILVGRSPREARDDRKRTKASPLPPPRVSLCSEGKGKKK